MKYELKTRQICLFIIALLPVTKMFTLSSTLMTYANEDLWISGLCNMLIDLLTISLLVTFCKSENRNFYTILEDCFGKVGKNIILFLYVIFFLTKAFLPISEQKDYIEYTLYNTMPNNIYFTPFFILAFFELPINFPEVLYPYILLSEGTFIS